VVSEPAPTPPLLFWRALTQGAAPAAFGYLAASMRAALGIGRAFPVAVRAQAIALILTVALVLAGGGAALAAGAAGILHALQPRPAPERPAVVDRSATPSPDPARDTPTAKPKDAKPGNSGPGAGPRGGSGHDRDSEDGDDEEEGDDGHDGDRSGPSAGDRSDDGGSSSDRSDDDRSGSVNKHGGSPDSDG
jgi:hypothetical protein